ncbi:winged helix-turn-helix domain-containing protein [Marilutibacter alkalisoli]|uniref:OmpR/PhoB-type domain-containing protein n=1 Tax=Marilutibacter alkalisoli TaxID=2591633 RepID=A0A514BTK0_9GAMM|nr:winged helix-turn-helix domain-containing protein [Lysobacter alkalisoli]QDH70734.1 hypothetical protein FKV23_12070 [Lysobacter alkalisoli]
MTASTHQANPRPWTEHAQRLRVGDLWIDLLHRRIERPDGQIELPNRMFELLLLFLAEPNALHTRARLFERIWPGVVVEDSNLSQSVWMLRKALGPERKHWIRTVARNGYVFEPPTPVEEDARTSMQANDPGPIPPASVAPGSGQQAEARKATVRAMPSGDRAHRSGHLLLAAVLVAALGLGLAVLHRLAAPRPASTAPVAIALIEVGDRAAASDTRWPAKLLHAWLGWKLTHLPEAVLLTEAQLAADAATLPPTIVLISSGHSPAAPDEIFVRASFGQGTDGEQIEMRGTASQVPALVDALSQQVLARLLPSRAKTAWPELDIDADAARSFGDAHDALKARDWSSATGLLQDVVRQAPRFGLARLDLAVAQGHLGQNAGAREQMATARELLVPVPDDAEPLLDALALSIDPRQFIEAAEAYGSLAQIYPQRTGFALEQARLLVQAGQVEQALEILSQPVWDRQPTGLRITRQLTLTQANMMLGDYERGRAEAIITERMTQAAGPGWTLERARALLMMATAGNILDRESADLSLYEQAAEQFELAGDNIRATLARYQARWARDPHDVENPLLDSLLAETHAGGHHNLEITLLRQVAFSHYNAGRHEQYRQRLEQALATAMTSGDRYRQNQLDLDLLNEDLLLGDFPGAGHRMQRLRSGPLQGDAAAWVAQFDAYLQQLHGDTGAALATLDRDMQHPKQDTAVELPPLSAARLACVRAGLLLAQGQLAPARTELGRCNGHDHPSIRQYAELIAASADLLAGNRAATLDRLQVLDAMIDADLDGPDRWMLSLWQADLLTRSGELEQARRLYEEVLPPVRKADYGWLATLTLAGLAEVAAARGDWKESRRHLDAARLSATADVWLLTRRLEQVAIVLALAAGDHQQALERLASIHAEAHRLGDTVTLLELHSLMPPDMQSGDCNRATRVAILAETGLRGADLDWLTATLQATKRAALTQHSPLR